MGSAHSASGVLSKAKLKLIERFFPNATPATLETLEIMLNVDEVSAYLTSLKESQSGQVVSMNRAFEDL
jgi:hypothetical protein